MPDAGTEVPWLGDPSIPRYLVPYIIWDGRSGMGNPPIGWVWAGVASSPPLLPGEWALPPGDGERPIPSRGWHGLDALTDRKCHYCGARMWKRESGATPLALREGTGAYSDTCAFHSVVGGLSQPLTIPRMGREWRHYLPVGGGFHPTPEETGEHLLSWARSLPEWEMARTNFWEFMKVEMLQRLRLHGWGGGFPSPLSRRCACAGCRG